MKVLLNKLTAISLATLMMGSAHAEFMCSVHNNADQTFTALSHWQFVGETKSYFSCFKSGTYHCHEMACTIVPDVQTALLDTSDILPQPQAANSPVTSFAISNSASERASQPVMALNMPATSRGEQTKIHTVVVKHFAKAAVLTKPETKPVVMASAAHMDTPVPRTQPPVSHAAVMQPAETPAAMMQPAIVHAAVMQPAETPAPTMQPAHKQPKPAGLKPAHSTEIPAAPIKPAHPATKPMEPEQPAQAPVIPIEPTPAPVTLAPVVEAPVTPSDDSAASTTPAEHARQPIAINEESMHAARKHLITHHAPVVIASSETVTTETTTVTTQVAPAPTPAPVSAPVAEPAPAPVIVPEPKPAPVITPEPEPKPAPAPEPVPAPVPQPEQPAPAPEVAPAPVAVPVAAPVEEKKADEPAADAAPASDTSAN